MIRIKKLHLFIFKTFFPLFVATFSVCLFILLMQFVWIYVNDMIGKGVNMEILAKLFFYSSLSFIPMALPLSILLASLMTFGKLGEQSELLAIKTSGISLLKIMKPLAYFAAIISLISFLFQNYVVPQVQTKMFTIVISLREKSPELNIPEKTFYKEIPGYSIYVKKKKRKTGMLYNIKIYDYSKGFENAVIVSADSGKLNISMNKKHLILTLYNGELFQNIHTGRIEKIQYRIEKFGLRRTLIDFDSRFTMEDESALRKIDSNKNVKELISCIDSVLHEEDSIRKARIEHFKQTIYKTSFKNEKYYSLKKKSSSSFEFFYNHLSPNKKKIYAQYARQKVRRVNFEYQFIAYRQMNCQEKLRSHYIYLYKKFSLPLSCFFFFFIGAPLGAIIRKGGLGFPAFLSVVIFIFYYTVDTFGIKLVKQGIISSEKGIWLSTAILIVLGIFLSHQSINDRIITNRDFWMHSIQKLIKKNGD